VIDQKTIFITGAASGIGRATALYFAQRGWFIGLGDIDRKGLGELADQLGPEKCHAAQLDVTNRAQWDDALSGFSARTGGRLDLFFNNAGIGGGGPFESVPEETAAAIMKVNFEAVVHGLYAAMPLLRHTALEAGRAQVVNTGSAAGIVATPDLAIYSATKFAVRGLTEALHGEYRSLNIFVSEIQPWFLNTQILESAVYGSNESARERLKALKIPVLPVELAAKAVWRLAHARNPRLHVAVGRPAQLLQILSRFFPSLARGGIRRRAQGK
jgi:NADP-dependent 3-hydroxy acid dehydrogenase YdfG